MAQSKITELQNTIKELERTWGHLQVKYYNENAVNISKHRPRKQKSTTKT